MNAARAIDCLSALAQETRLGVFRLLVEAGNAGLAAGTLAERLGVPASSLSFHLAELHRAGLVDQRRESRSLIYSANYRAMNGLVGFLTENCCGGNMTACAPALAAPPSARAKGVRRETPARARRR